jgi:GTP cyclohydrolase I
MRRGIVLFVSGIAAGAPDAPGARAMAGTPARVAAAWSRDLLSGYRQDPATILAPLAERSSRGLVAVRDIGFTSVCMHHLLPFEGKAHVAYAPDGRIAGLSRIARLVDCLARRLQLQEHLGSQIAGAIQESLRPLGAACLIEASHACVAARAARKTGSRIVTAAFTGEFLSSSARRREVLAILRSSG